MLPPFQLEQAINQLVREEWGRLLAALVRWTNDIAFAEDVLQDAVESALIGWPDTGLPDNPSAWIFQAARHKALDRFRRDKRFRELQPDIILTERLQRKCDDSHDQLATIPDARLELIFTCCHPALDRMASVALTLRTLGGLSTEQIAHAFMVKPVTMGQRLSRATSKIKHAGIPFEIPEKSQLAERLHAVLGVLYLIFNEGYASSTGDNLSRPALADEAIRLGRILRHLLPDEAEVAGLLSLMLLHDSRRHARQLEDVPFVRLEDQDRNLWDVHQMEEGRCLLKRTLQAQRVGPYQLQACISAVHADATHWDATDWSQITALYELLYSVMPSPVVRVNQAVALSYAHGVHAALALLEEVAEHKEMLQYTPFFAARADLLRRAGLPDAAEEAYTQAISSSANEAERDVLVALRNKLKT